MDMALGLGVIKWSACSPCDPRSNPADVSSFYVKFVFEKNENKQKGREWPIFEKTWRWHSTNNLVSTIK